MENEFFKHYVFKGSHKEVGRQHGEALRQPIQEHLATIYDLTSRISGIDQSRALSTAAMFRPYIERWAPGFWEELEGLGQGAGITSEEALLLQVRQEVVYLAKYGQQGFECTSYAIGAEYTSDGKVYSGQNADLNGDFESFSNVVTFAVEGKPQVMMVVPAGQISYLGINSEGMGVNCNFLACTGWKKGYPRYLISRLVMEQPTFEKACETLEGLTERASSRNVMITDRNGNIADYETTATDMGKVSAKGMFVHANHFVVPEMLQYEEEKGDGLEETRWRQQRLTELIQENKGRIDIEKIKEFLQDHQGTFSSLCMHPSESTGYYHTFASIINCLSDCALEVCKGNPCEGRYFRYEFQ